MWISQGKYMSDCVRICPDHAGLFTSLFWTIASASQIFSYLFNSIFLSKFEPKYLFFVSSLISIIAMVWIAFLPDPKLPEENNKNQNM